MGAAGRRETCTPGSRRLTREGGVTDRGSPRGSSCLALTLQDFLPSVPPFSCISGISVSLPAKLYFSRAGNNPTDPHVISVPSARKAGGPAVGPHGLSLEEESVFSQSLFETAHGLSKWCSAEMPPPGQGLAIGSELRAPHDAQLPGTGVGLWAQWPFLLPN